MTKPFKIWIEDGATLNKVLAKMEKEGITWVTGAKPLDNDIYPIPIGLFVPTTNSLTYTSDAEYYSDKKLYSEITPEKYLKENKTMTKADLKDWMIVTDNEGKKYIVDRVHEVLLEYGAVDKVNRVLVLDNITDDLHSIDDDFYITRVFEPSEMQLSHIFDGDACLSSMDLIWIRPTPPAVEMTVAEIEEKLGIKNLKIVKENEDGSHD